jgi:hypothetical protein
VDWIHLAKDTAKWRAVVNSTVGLLCCMELVAWFVGWLVTGLVLDWLVAWLTGYWVNPRLVSRLVGWLLG